jgi:hypothetical protein
VRHSFLSRRSNEKLKLSKLKSRVLNSSRLQKSHGVTVVIFYLTYFLKLKHLGDLSAYFIVSAFGGDFENDGCAYL